MSAELMGRVWKLKLSHGQQAVMLALADHAHDDGTRCYPGVPYLAWKTGYSERNVIRLLGELEVAEIIEAQNDKRGGAGNVTEYHIHVEKGDKKDEYNPDNSRKTLTSQPKRVTDETQNPDKSAEKGDKSNIGHYIHAGAFEPSGNHKEPSVEGPMLDDTTTTCLKILLEVKDFPRSQADNALKLAEWRKEFPNADPVEVCQDFKAYHEEHRSKKPSRLRLRNFFKQAAKNPANGNGGARSPALTTGASGEARRKDGYAWLFE